MILLSPKEMDKLAWLWEFHRKDCRNHRDIKIEMLPGGGIGTVVQATCGCGTELDATDYYSW
jgi:hypothetical protein